MTIQTATVTVVDSASGAPVTTASIAPPPAAIGGVAFRNSGQGVYVVTWDDTIDVTGFVIVSAPKYLNSPMTLVPGWSFTVHLVLQTPVAGPAPTFTQFSVKRDVFANSFTVTYDVVSNDPSVTFYTLTKDIGGGPNTYAGIGFSPGTDSVIYSHAATFNLVYTATDTNGTATAKATVPVNCPAPTVNISFDNANTISAMDGSAVFDFAIQSFTAVAQIGAPNNAVAGIKQFIFDWGDGSQTDMTGDVALDGNGRFSSRTGHWFPASGNYTVTATIVDAWGQSTKSSAAISWQYRYQSPGVTFDKVITTTSTNGDTVVISGAVQQLDYWYRVTNIQIDWGDGKVDTLPFVPNSQWESNISFVGNHVYPEGWAGGQVATATLMVTTGFEVTKAPISFLLPMLVQFKTNTGITVPTIYIPTYWRRPFPLT